MLMAKLFGGGKKNKKDGFYLAIDESKEDKQTEGAVAAPPQPEAEKKAEVVEEKKAEVVEEKKAKPVKAKKTTSKKKSVKEAAPTAPVTTSSSQLASDAPEWVKAMYKSSNGKAGNQEATTFAPDNLMPIPSNSRRKPGPSMSMFMKMAREVKTPMIKK